MQTTIEVKEKPLGVIESLQLGFNYLNQHLWLLIPPVLLDIFLWFGPRISISALMTQFLDILASQPDLPQEFSTNFSAASESLKNIGTQYNLLSLLAGVFTGMPSLLARLDFAKLGAASGDVIALTSWQGALMWVSILIPIGIFIGSFWLTCVVYALRRERLFSKAFFGRWGWLWLNANLYLILLFVGLMAFSLFIGLIGAMLTMALGSAGALMFSVFWMLFIGFSIWLSIGLYFVLTAIALDGVNVASAIWRSLNVVGRNALSILGFLILAVLLTEGFSRIWWQLSAKTWGVFLSIIGNAYLGSAIVAASFLLYQSRYQHWQKNRALVVLSQQSGKHDIETKEDK